MGEKLLKLTSFNRRSTEDREYFNLTFSESTASISKISISFSDDGVTQQYDLIITEKSGKEISGFIDEIISGTFTIAGITIEAPDGDISINPERPIAEGTELIKTSLEPFKVTRFYFGRNSYSGSTFRALVNRIADSGASGLNLSKTVATGWNIPGILEPQEITEEDLQEKIDQPYSDDKQSECFLIGDEVVLLRVLPEGNRTIRANLNSVYTFSVTQSVRTNFVGEAQNRLLVQASSNNPVVFYNELGVSGSNITYPISGSDRFNPEIRNMYLNSFPALRASTASSLVIAKVREGQNRPASEYVSVPNDIGIIYQ